MVLLAKNLFIGSLICSHLSLSCFGCCWLLIGTVCYIFPQVRDQMIAQEYYIYCLTFCFEFGICISSSEVPDGSSGVLYTGCLLTWMGNIFPQVRDQMIAQEYYISLCNCLFS